ncbi:MAG TPA: DUF1264 domain-containing protein [Longimicrobiales bacterium]
MEGRVKTRRVLLLGMPAALAAGIVLGSIADLGAAPEATGAADGPLAGYTTHLVATHFLRGREYRTHHYFKPLREGVLQGLVFREAADGAAMIEVEWAIAPAVYEALPEWQKAYWHPLFPAVDAGRVELPDLPDAEEREMLGTVRTLYAQTLNLAGLEGELPVGLEGVAMVTHLTAAEMRRLMAGR